MQRDDLRYRIGADTSGVDAAWQRIKRQARQTGNSIDTAMGRARSGVQSMVAPLRTVQGLLSTLGIGIGLSQVRRMVAEVAEIETVADKVGLTTEALQEFRFAAEQTDVAAGTFDTAMQRFSRRIAEVASGANNDLAGVLKANNIQLRDQEGNLRRQEDLLADYADLIKNARNEQDQLRLAFIAFDSEGAAMVNTLRNGSEGLDYYRQRAQELGVVLEDELIEKATDFDNKWSEAWLVFETNAKSAMAGVVDSTQEMMRELDASAQALRDFWNDPNLRDLSRGLIGDDATDWLIGRDADFSQSPPRRGARRRTPDQSGDETIIPGDDDDEGDNGSGRRSAVSELEKQQKAIQRVIDTLEHEFSLIGRSETQKRVMNELRRAGAEATSEEGRRIAELVTEIESKNAAAEREQELAESRQESYENLFDMGNDALRSFIDNSLEADEAVKRLGVDLAFAAAQAALLGSGPLSGLFGGGGFFGGGAAADPWAGLRTVTGFDRGGYTGDGNTSDVAGVVHRREYVVDADATAKYRPILDAMNAGRNIGMFDMPAMISREGESGAGRNKLDVEIFVRDNGTLGAIAHEAGREGGAEAADVRVRTFSKSELPYRLQEINNKPRIIG